jgi:hypothetical protein
MWGLNNRRPQISQRPARWSLAPACCSSRSTNILGSVGLLLGLCVVGGGIYYGHEIGERKARSKIDFPAQIRYLVGH